MEIGWNFHCAEFAVRSASETLGRDIWVEVGGCPRSAREAAALYRRLGVTNLSDAATVVFGDPVDPKRAMRGDIVMVDGALGICRGDWVECADRMQPLRRGTKAWRVTNRP